MIPVVEHLPCKSHVLCLIQSTAKKKKKKDEDEGAMFHRGCGTLLT
jgi:hypothetical protein